MAVDRPAQYGSRRRRLISFPLGSRGSSATKSIDLGHFNFASLPSSDARISAASSSEGSGRRDDGLDHRQPVGFLPRTLPEPHQPPPIRDRTDPPLSYADAPTGCSSSSYSSSSGRLLSTRPAISRTTPSRPATIGMVTLIRLILVASPLSVLTADVTLSGVVWKLALSRTRRVVPVLSCSVSWTFRCTESGKPVTGSTKYISLAL